MKLKILNRVIACGVVTVLASCIPASQRSAADEIPKGLFGAADARNVKTRTAENGAVEMTYEVERAYPANEFLEQIATAAKSGGFEPLADDWLNPGVPSSHSVGWGTFIDAQVTPQVRMHQWLAQWRDASGNVIVYGLRYRSPVDRMDAPDNTRLSVGAGWIPAAQAEQMMEAAQQPLPQQ
jgi:hypothetical protein